VSYWIRSHDGQRVINLDHVVAVAIDQAEHQLIAHGSDGKTYSIMSGTAAECAVAIERFVDGLGDDDDDGDDDDKQALS
jgi:hypothetical protein